MRTPLEELLADRRRLAATAARRAESEPNDDLAMIYEEWAQELKDEADAIANKLKPTRGGVFDRAQNGQRPPANSGSHRAEGRVH